MTDFIGKYDEQTAFLALIEILEIKGENKIIKELKQSSIRAFKENYQDGFNIDWVISMTLRARKEAVKSAKLSS